MALVENLKQNKQYHKLAKKLGLDYIEVLGADEHGFVHDPQTNNIICKIEPITKDGIMDHLNVHKVIRIHRKRTMDERIAEADKNGWHVHKTDEWKSVTMLGTFYAGKWTWYPYVVDALDDCVPIVAGVPDGGIQALFNESRKTVATALSKQNGENPSTFENFILDEQR